MRQQIELGIQERELYECIQELEGLNEELAALNLRKEALTERIIDLLGHSHEGERTYELGAWNVKARTPMVYSLDTKVYKSGEVFLEDAFNPIEEKTTYTVNKAKAEMYFNNAPLSVREALQKLITKKPSKPSVIISMRTK